MISCESAEDCDIYVVHEVTNRDTMDCTITIEDSEEDGEIIDLESSQDAANNVIQNSVEGEKIEEKLLKSTELVEDSKLVKTVTDDTSKVSPSNEYLKPFVKIIFRDESVTREYGERIKQFLHDLMKSTSKQKTTCKFSKDTLEVWEEESFEKKSVAEGKNTEVEVKKTEIETEEKRSKRKEIEAEKKKQKRKKVEAQGGGKRNKNKEVEKKKQKRKRADADEKEMDNNTLCSSLFIIDTQPKHQKDFDIPNYEKKFEDIFERKARETEDEVNSKITCFNCLGKHLLRDCTEPRNYANISKNRKELHAMGIGRNIRYHTEEVQRFSHMIPGQISKDLRNALGLRDNELPRHIYKMRILGYPPGWLEEARLPHSGLSLFNSDGVAEMDPNEEPGEITSEGDKDRYNIKKIFDFPGFNVPPPPNTHDDHERYSAPPMDAYHSKEKMLMQLRGKEAPEGYKKKKLELSGTLKSNDSICTPCDMEVDDLNDVEVTIENVRIDSLFVTPLPKNSTPNVSLSAHSSPLTENNTNQFQDWMDQSTSSLSGGMSPPLSDLENMKKQLLGQLEESSLQSDLETPIKHNSSTDSNRKLETPTSPVENSSKSSHQESVQSTPTNTSIGSTKSIDLGTPILQSTSLYNKLPSYEKFSKNISDVMDFQNLPESTGKYEKMTELLQKVRNVMANIYED